MVANFLKAILHNIGVILVGFIVAFIGLKLDQLLGTYAISSKPVFILGLVLLTAGFLLRVWATFYFYQSRMKVIVLKPQRKLITGGPFKFSRNPLYLGGNVSIFLGASLTLGTLMGVIITILHLPLVNKMIKREEKQLEKEFGEQWRSYQKRVRRWI